MLQARKRTRTGVLQARKQTRTGAYIKLPNGVTAHISGIGDLSDLYDSYRSNGSQEYESLYNGPHAPS